jgi:hypothetical protein
MYAGAAPGVNTLCEATGRCASKEQRRNKMEQSWKMPPLIKIYEAMGAIGDGRVRIVDETNALVNSSDSSKTYKVVTADGGRAIASDDNASFWQGYLGYPGIAVLLARGILKVPANVCDALADIPWKEINSRYRNDYTKTLAEVSQIVEQSGHDPDAVAAEAQNLLEALAALAPYRSARPRPAKPGRG